jgi:hypothetical protein
MSNLKPLYTRWGAALDKACPLNDYPRPQLKRDNWLCLNGVWEYAISDKRPEKYDGEIIVPFSPESLLSGVGRQLLPGQTLWYRRVASFDAVPPGKRLLLHFGAVDQRCEVFVNGNRVGGHSGGYWPFHFDITDVATQGDNVLAVVVRDDSDKGVEAYGKQKLERGGIWYTAQSGIWQTVWAETVPERHIENIRITPRCTQSEAEFRITFSKPGNHSAFIRIFDDGRLVSEGSAGDDPFRLAMPDFRYWSPEDPFLYTVKISFGEDEIESYFGMRHFSVEKERLTLNGKPIFHNGLLDQGYWSDTPRPATRRCVMISKSIRKWVSIWLAST